MDKEILGKDFFRRDARIVAKDLLGKVLVRNYNGNILKGKIVETEAYIGRIDKASHAYGGRKTNRTITLYSEAGTSYVYSIYGMYYCFNTITGEEGEAEGVLIRALEPLEGLDTISINRFKRPFEELSKKQVLNLTSGPGKLCIAFTIDKDINKASLFTEDIHICNGDNKEFEVVESKRIGIDYAEEAKDFLWRYYIKGNDFVSKK